MIKEYDDPSTPSVIPVANVVGLKGDSVVTEEPVGTEVKLKNSVVLATVIWTLNLVPFSGGERYYDRADWRLSRMMFLSKQMQYNMI